MALSEPRVVFGIHSLTPYNRATQEPYGILKVLGDAEVSFAMNSQDLYGGSNKHPVASEITQATSEFTASVKQYQDFMFEKFLGASVSTTAASATGTIGAIANVSGTSAVNATTGIASVAMKAASQAELKFGTYVVKVIGATTVDVFVSTDISFKTKGTDESYENDLLKVTATPLTVPGTGGTVDLDNFGITITGGSGAIAMTPGDTASFTVVPPHGGISSIVIGQESISFPEVGMWIMAQERSDGSYFEIDAHRVKSSAGMVIPLPEGNFSITGLTCKMLFDSTLEKVATITAAAGE